MSKNKVGIEYYRITGREHKEVSCNQKEILKEFINEIELAVEYDKIESGDFMLFSVNNQYKVIGFETGDFIRLSCCEVALSRKKLTLLRKELRGFIRDVFNGLSVADNRVLKGL